MIEEVGTVVELKGKLVAVVMCTKSSLCENCATNGNCAIGDDGNTRLIEVQNPLAAVSASRFASQPQRSLSCSLLFCYISSP